MTDFINFDPSEYAVDAPATALHFERWFRNWIAGFEGAPGAPRFHLAALQSPAAGTVPRLAREAEHNSGLGPDWVLSVRVQMMQAGNIRVALDQKTSTGLGDARVTRETAGAVTVLQTWSVTANTWTARTLDFAVAVGDVVRVEHRGQNNVHTHDLRLVRLQTAGEWLWPGPDTTGVILK